MAVVARTQQNRNVEAVSRRRVPTATSSAATSGLGLGQNDGSRGRAPLGQLSQFVVRRPDFPEHVDLGHRGDRRGKVKQPARVERRDTGVQGTGSISSARSAAGAEWVR